NGSLVGEHAGQGFGALAYAWNILQAFAQKHGSRRALAEDTLELVPAYRLSDETRGPLCPRFHTSHFLQKWYVAPVDKRTVMHACALHGAALSGQAIKLR